MPAPKKPRSTYLLFTQAMRPQVDEAHPGKSLGDKSKEFSKLWKATTETAKAPYIALHKAEKDLYDKAMSTYVPTAEDVQKAQTKKARRMKKKAKKLEGTTGAVRLTCTAESDADTSADTSTSTSTRKSVTRDGAKPSAYLLFVTTLRQPALASVLNVFSTGKQFPVYALKDKAAKHAVPATTYVQKGPAAGALYVTKETKTILSQTMLTRVAAYQWKNLAAGKKAVWEAATTAFIGKHYTEAKGKWTPKDPAHIDNGKALLGKMIAGDISTLITALNSTFGGGGKRAKASGGGKRKRRKASARKK
jgi:hypothetical protein